MTEKNSKLLNIQRYISATLNRYKIAILNGLQFGGDRDLYQVLGYPRVLEPKDYWEMYRRGGLAKRIVNAYPDATWRSAPRRSALRIMEDEDKDNVTAFEDAVDKLDKKHRLWSYCHRADRLSMTGEYSVLFFGFNDMQDPKDPVRRATAINFIRPVGQRHAVITKYGDDPKSDMFGKPVEYRISLRDETDQAAVTMADSILVHHTRVVHIANDLLENDVFGTPILEAVFNNLFDIAKLSGGSAEVYWLNARAGMQFVTRDGEAVPDVDGLMEEAEEYQHQLRRFMTAQGGEWKSVGNQAIADPTGPFNIQISVISGTTGIPQRILLGSERGQLASGQDETNWLSRVNERRTNSVDPTIIRPVINLLITVGILKPPKIEDWGVEWDSAANLSELDKASINEKKTNSLATYSNSLGAAMVVPPEEFRFEFLGLPEQPKGGFPEEEEEPDETDTDVDSVPPPGGDDEETAVQG